MANQTNTNNSLQSAALPTSNPKVLTVVVLDEKSQPASGAKVSITPSDFSGVTNSAGEIQFKLGTATKYEITAASNGKTVTVPYYVTENGATRLVVNPVYVKKIEQQLNPSFFNSDMAMNIGIGVGIVIVLIIIWKLFTGKHRRRK